MRIKLPLLCAALFTILDQGSTYFALHLGAIESHYLPAYFYQFGAYGFIYYALSIEFPFSLMFFSIVQEFELPKWTYAVLILIVPVINLLGVFKFI